MRPPRTGGLPLWAGHAMAAEELIARVRSVVGEEHLTTLPERLAARAVEGVSPAALVQPGSPEEVGDVLRAAGEAGGAVIPWGAGLHQHLGGIPRRADLIVETTRLQGITDYTPADYVVSVRTGTRLGEVQEALGAHGQWLPLDPPGGEGETLGGLIAANRNGPRRLLWGSIRDLLIGIKVALPTGEVVKAGGKVVKNVAGYDLVKLFIGSFGAMGIITEATFKVSPRPPEALTILVTVPDLATAHAITSAVMRSYLLPSALEAVNPPALDRLLTLAGLDGSRDRRWGVLLLAEGLHENLQRHVREVNQAAKDLGNVEVLSGRPHEALWQAIAEFPSPAGHPGRVLLRAGGPIARWVEFARTADGGAREGRIEVLAHAGAGIVYAAAPAESGPALVAAMGETATRVEGYVVVEVAPPHLKASLPLWGPPPDGLDLMRKLRAQFDPQGIMVPGRLGWSLS